MWFAVIDLVAIVIGADRARYRAALTFALAQRALGGSARVHLHDEAVPLLAEPDPVLDEALDARVAVSFCQTGLATAGMRADRLDPRLIPDGPVSVLATSGEGRLAIF